MIRFLSSLVGAVAGVLVGRYLPLLLETPPEGPWWWCRMAECLPPGQPVLQTGTPQAESSSDLEVPWMVGAVIGLALPTPVVALGLFLLLARLGTPLRRVRRIDHLGDTVEVRLTWQAPGWKRTLYWTLTPEVFAMLGQAFGWCQQVGGELSCLYLVAELMLDEDVKTLHPGPDWATLSLRARQAATLEQATWRGRLMSRWRYRKMLRVAEASRSRRPLTSSALWSAIQATCPVSARLMRASEGT